MAKGKIRNAVIHFRGRSEHALDEKGRLNIATRFRDVLKAKYDERLMVTPWRNFLKAYPVPQWEELELALLREGRKQPQLKKMMRFLVGGVVECTLDKQGRILLPPALRAEGNITRDVIVSGMLNHIEIWDKGTWAQSIIPTAENFDEFEQACNLLDFV